MNLYTNYIKYLANIKLGNCKFKYVIYKNIFRTIQTNKYLQFPKSEIY